jgi:hypothetical protein
MIGAGDTERAATRSVLVSARRYAAEFGDIAKA